MTYTDEERREAVINRTEIQCEEIADLLDSVHSFDSDEWKDEAANFFYRYLEAAKVDAAEINHDRNFGKYSDAA